MNELIIDDKSISFENPGEIISMGGPWAADLLIEKKEALKNVIIDNYYVDYDNHRFYFILYYPTTEKNRLSLCYLDTLTLSIYLYSGFFEIIFISKVINSETLEYYDAFHDKNMSYKNSQKLIKEKWHLYKQVSI